jgi:hypothetical protein
MGYNGTVHQLFTDFKKLYVSVRKEILYNILSKFSIPMKLVGLNSMCVNETYCHLIECDYRQGLDW